MYMVFITFYSNVFFLAVYILSPHLVIRLFEMADEAGGLEQGGAVVWLSARRRRIRVRSSGRVARWTARAM